MYLERPLRIGPLICIWKLLEMFRITKKIAIVTSLMAFCSGYFDAYGSSSNEELEVFSNRQIVVVSNEKVRQLGDEVTGPADERFQAGIPADVMRLIFKKASMNTVPTDLQLVCRHWRDSMRKKEKATPGIKFSALNAFMQECMYIYWKERFRNGFLSCKSAAGEEIRLKVSDPEVVVNGTFDLATCGNAVNYLVITTDVEQFFKVREGNEDKVVILIALRQLVEQEIESSAKSFQDIMDGWDVSKAPVGIFWRWGNDVDSGLFDYLIVSSLSVLSAKSLFENWSTLGTHTHNTTHKLWRIRFWRKARTRIGGGRDGLLHEHAVGGGGAHDFMFVL